MSLNNEVPVQQDNERGTSPQQKNEPVRELKPAAHFASESGFPGCSKGQGRTAMLVVTGSTMQAYVAMKGPGTDMKDPLMQWIASKEAGTQTKREFTLLGGIEDSFKDRDDCRARGPPSHEGEEMRRKAIFTYDRPRIKHFKMKYPELTKDFDADSLEDIHQGYDNSADGWKTYAASDVSDDGEGDPADGRISPCTFAQWAEGAEKWDVPGDKYRSAWEKRTTFNIPDSRLRPFSPNSFQPRKAKRRNAQSIYDEEDGKELSPACSSYAKTEPSLLWSAPPMDPLLPYDYYNHTFDRMDPELMRLVRKNNTTTEPSWGVESASEPEQYTPSEVEGATDKYWGLAHTQGIIASKHQEVAWLFVAEEHANAAAERLRHDVKRLKHENRKLADCFELHRTTRDRRIMKQVQRHISELRYVAKAKLAETKARLRERDQLQSEHDSHNRVQRQLLAMFGKETPAQVFSMYPDVWESAEARKNPRNFS